MKKKTKVIFALVVLLLMVTGVTVVFLLKDEKQVGTLASNTAIETENLQDKEQEGKYADTEIKTTSEKTTEASEKEKEKTDKQDKTTEASAATDKPSTTQASVQGLSSSSAATGKPNAVEAPATEKPNVTEAPATAEKPKTTEAPATTETPNITEAPAPFHVHKWKTINHPAETHQEEQLVSPAWDEDIYEYHIYCNACGTYLENMSSDELGAHCYDCNSGYSSGTVKVGTKHHEAEYETVTVVDKEAWTETVCETCGERK